MELGIGNLKLGQLDMESGVKNLLLELGFGIHFHIFALTFISSIVPIRHIQSIVTAAKTTTGIPSTHGDYKEK